MVIYSGVKFIGNLCWIHLNFAKIVIIFLSCFYGLWPQFCGLRPQTNFIYSGYLNIKFNGLVVWLVLGLLSFVSGWSDRPTVSLVCLLTVLLVVFYFDTLRIKNSFAFYKLSLKVVVVTAADGRQKATVELQLFKVSRSY